MDTGTRNRAVYVRYQVPNAEKVMTFGYVIQLPGAAFTAVIESDISARTAEECFKRLIIELESYKTSPQKT